MECRNTTTSDNDAYLKGSALYNPAAPIWASWTTIGLHCLPSNLLLVNGDHRGLKSDRVVIIMVVITMMIIPIMIIVIMRMPIMLGIMMMKGKGENGDDEENDDG